MVLKRILASCIPFTFKMTFLSPPLLCNPTWQTSCNKWSPGTTLSCFTFNEQNENICPSLKISQMLEHELNCIRGMLFDKVHPFRTANQKWREKHFQDMKSSFKEHPDFDLSVNTWLLYQTNIRLYKNSATPQTTFLAHLLFYTLIYEYRLHEYTS